jgi:hypothetical protein
MSVSKKRLRSSWQFFTSEVYNDNYFSPNKKNFSINNLIDEDKSDLVTNGLSTCGKSELSSEEYKMNRNEELTNDRKINIFEIDNDLIDYNCDESMCYDDGILFHDFKVDCNSGFLNKFFFIII